VALAGPALGGLGSSSWCCCGGVAWSGASATWPAERRTQRHWPPLPDACVRSHSSTGRPSVSWWGHAFPVAGRSHYQANIMGLALIFVVLGLGLNITSVWRPARPRLPSPLRHRRLLLACQHRTDRLLDPVCPRRLTGALCGVARLSDPAPAGITWRLSPRLWCHRQIVFETGRSCLEVHRGCGVAGPSVRSGDGHRSVTIFSTISLAFGTDGVRHRRLQHSASPSLGPARG